MATTVDTLLVRIEADLAGLRRDLKRVEQTTEQSSKKMGRSLNNIDTGFQKIGRTAKALAPILAGALGVGAVRSFVKVGSEVENLQVRLRFLFGDVEEGAKAFEVMSQFASKVPFSLQEIQNASGTLASVANNANELNELLKITGNVAAVSGLSFEMAAGNLQRAFAAGANSADLFRERGVLAMAGFEVGAKVSIEETITKFQEAFGTGGKMDGATKELSKTFTGTMSMLGDAVFNFQRQVSDSGLLDAFRELAEFLRENVAETDRLARVIGGTLAAAVRGITTALKFVLENLTSIIIAIGVFASIKTVAAIAGVGMAFVSLATNVAKAGGALKALRMVLLASPLTAIAVAAAVAAEQMGLLDPVLAKIKSKFAELYPEVDTTEEKTGALTTEIKNLAETLTGGANASKATSEFTKQTKSLGDRLEIAKLEAQGYNSEFAKIMQQSGFDPQKMKIEGEVEGITPAVFRTGEQATDTDRMKELRNQFEQLAVAQKKVDNINIAEGILESRDAAGQMQTQMVALNEALAVMPERKDEINAAISDLGVQMNRLDPMFKSTMDAAQQAGDAVADVLAEAVMKGKLDADALKSIFANLVQQLIAEAIKTFVIKKIMSAVFGGFGGGGSVSGGLAGGGSIPAFAAGGRIPARAGGGPVLVGERGPELFIPHSGGVIKNKMDTKNMLQGGGSPVNVYQTINVDSGVSQTVKSEMMNMLPRFKAETMQAVIDGKRRGKAISKVFA